MGGFNNSLWNGDTFGGPAAASASAVTVSKITYTALRLAGVLWKPGRGGSGSETAEALDVLNSWLDSLNTNRGNIYTVSIRQWPTVANQQTYTIGQDPTGTLAANWDGPRPVKITGANLLLPTTPVVRRPIRILTDDEWRAIRLQEVYTYPASLYNDGAHPLSTIYFKPIPDGVYQVEMFTWLALVGFVGLDDVVVLPPGYQRALEYNLGAELHARYPDSKLTPRQVERLYSEAAKSKAELQRRNIASPKTSLIGYGGGRGGFDWLSGLPK